MPTDTESRRQGVRLEGTKGITAVPPDGQMPLVILEAAGGFFPLHQQSLADCPNGRVWTLTKVCLLEAPGFIVTLSALWFWASFVDISQGSRGEIPEREIQSTVIWDSKKGRLTSMDMPPTSRIFIKFSLKYIMQNWMSCHPFLKSPSSPVLCVCLKCFALYCLIN